VGVQAGAGCRAADAQPPQSLCAAPNALSVAADRFGIGTELLTQPHRHCVLQVGAPGFNHILEFQRLLLQRRRQPCHRRIQLVQPPQRAQADSGGDGVVGGLCHIDMVVGVHAVLPALTAQKLCGAISNHLVCVHVVAGSGARLEGIDHKLFIPTTVHHLLRRLDDRVGDLWLQQTQVAVNLGGSKFDHPHRPDESPPGFKPRNGEVLHGALGLDAVQCLLRYRQLTQRVPFGTKCGLHHAPPFNSIEKLYRNCPNNIVRDV